MAGSFYGKFFARRLNIYLLQRDPEQWKNLQINNKSTSQAPTPARVQSPAPPVSTPHTATNSARVKEGADEQAPAKSKKRKGDEIDQLFEAKLGKKVKKAGLGPDVAPSQPASVPKEEANETVKDGKEAKEKKRRKRDQGDLNGKDNDLKDILGAIKAAPKDDKSHKRKKRMA